MSRKTKRACDLSTEAVAHGRNLVGRVGSTVSQDSVVEIAVEHLYRDVREREESARWAKAAEDPKFKADMGALATAYRDAESWPS